MDIVQKIDLEVESRLSGLSDNQRNKAVWPVYLYVKVHRKTGLKYFGKTIQDIYKYQGSGTYWKHHLKKHGRDVKTILIGEYWSFDELVKKAVDFSVRNDIVKSSSWANHVLEDGLDGADPWATASEREREVWGNKISQSLLRHEVSEETRRRQSKKASQRTGKKNSFFGRTHSEETKRMIGEKTSEKLKGRTMSEEHKRNISNALKGRKLSEEHKRKLSESRGKHKNN